MALSSQKQENLAMTSAQSGLEATRAHLQKTLRQKEGDCNRMAVQIRVSLDIKVWRVSWFAVFVTPSPGFLASVSSEPCRVLRSAARDP